AYLKRVRCPFLFLSSTNDFNAPMEFVEKGMALINQEKKRTVYAAHLNHRFTPETEFSRVLWLDAHLKGKLRFPRTPQIQIKLEKGQDPEVIVKPDSSREIGHVDIYYGYGRDPRNRFWADGKAKSPVDSSKQVWTAKAPLFDLNEPLFVLANIYYRLNEDEKRETDPTEFVLSVADVRYPQELKKALVKSSSIRETLIDDFSRGWHDWYALNENNPHHWLFSTRKFADPRWQFPGSSRIEFEVLTTHPDNILGIQIRTNQWQHYLGKQFETWTAFVEVNNPGKRKILLSPSDFQNQQGDKMKDWQGITEFIFCPGNKTDSRQSKNLPPWQGKRPVFNNLRWNVDQ
ncbi:MAG: hypothetical protein VX438_09075, partial [Planctomycetota bacterium]|nr:hypothetical protein [Planctomycetota bacterium]